jgi:hypothetical protein
VSSFQGLGASDARAGTVHGKRKPPAKKKQKPLTFKVTVEIDSLRYWSNRSYPGVKENEQDYSKPDQDAAYTTYEDLKVPRQGSGSKAELKASSEFVDMPFENFGSSTDPETSYDCKGHLAKIDSRAELHAKPFQREGHGDLSLQIEVAKGYKIEGASGQFAPDVSCGKQFDGHTPFVPASAHDMPGMLTLDVNVKLSELRSIKVGKEKGSVVTEAKALKTPPTDCTEFNIVCTQHLDWKGKLFFERQS